MAKKMKRASLVPTILLVFCSCVLGCEGNAPPWSTDVDSHPPETREDTRDANAGDTNISDPTRADTHTAPPDAHTAPPDAVESVEPEPRRFLRVDPETVRFGHLVVGEAASEGVTVDNCGDADVTITAIALEQQGSGFVTEAALMLDDGPLVLSTGESVSFLVHYRPNVAGEASGMIIISNDVSLHSVVHLSGSAELPEPCPHAVLRAWIHQSPEATVEDDGSGVPPALECHPLGSVQLDARSTAVPPVTSGRSWRSRATRPVCSSRTAPTPARHCFWMRWGATWWSWSFSTVTMCGRAIQAVC